MDEQEWLGCEDLAAMLKLLKARTPSLFRRGILRGTVRERKLRLFVCACWRLLWDQMPDECCRRGLEVGERYADGLAGIEERAGAHEAIRRRMEKNVEDQDFEEAARFRDTSWPVSDDVGRDVYWLCGWINHKQEWTLLLRDIFANSFRPIALGPSWRTPTVLALAQAAYDNRTLPAGTLDPDRIAILADALEDAGCTDLDILGHLRGPGPHVRGCHVVDILLDKS